MRLADAGRAEQDDVLGALDEAETSQLADLLAIDRRLKVEIELLQALHPGEPGELEAALHPALVPAAPLGLEGLGEKALVVEVALGRVLADPIELGEEVLHLHALEEAGQLHVAVTGVIHIVPQRRLEDPLRPFDQALSSGTAGPAERRAPRGQGPGALQGAP